ncbi:class I SAM-dependent methyltransferase [Fodinibius halophilus]|uniref:Class I SAM-dependent methyltransferase n=1 Tax=Fodinibius halophilus TaxID=1736908 RepID=A0A6M1T133_9BACT|nr:class I SAM-dependent methyltransferase [Fodinibius halophilus]NGP87669.1 class I SAM-dependent methyltransferase [Fodinibius halophilus]
MKTEAEAKKFWNERYSGNHFVYGKHPNTFFKQQLDKLPTGKLLMPAEGEGRNAVYAAEQGWSVTAFDVSSKAQKKALELAKRHHVAITYEVNTFQDFSFEPNSFDAIGFIYAHIHESLRRELHRKFIKALKPGGTLLLEAFSKEQLENNSGGPGTLEMLYSKEELLTDFKSLDTSIAESLEVTLSEGDHHKGQANIIRIIAQKPGN